MIITRHKSRMKGHPDFYCGRANGAAFFGQSMKEVIRKQEEWLMDRQPVSEAREVAANDESSNIIQFTASN